MKWRRVLISTFGELKETDHFHVETYGKQLHNLGLRNTRFAAPDCSFLPLPIRQYRTATHVFFGGGRKKFKIWRGIRLNLIGVWGAFEESMEAGGWAHGTRMCPISGPHDSVDEIKADNLDSCQ